MIFISLAAKLLEVNMSEARSATERGNLIVTHAVWRTVSFPPSGRHTHLSHSVQREQGRGEDTRLCFFIESRNGTTGRLVGVSILVKVERYSEVHESVAVLKLSNIPRLRSVFLH
jgi:hypothetical protein